MLKTAQKKINLEKEFILLLAEGHGMGLCQPILIHDVKDNIVGSRHAKTVILVL
jgi:hypothetical protein